MLQERPHPTPTQDAETEIQADEGRPKNGNRRKTEMTNTATRVKTGEVRLSYVHLDEPHAFDESQKAKYSVTLIIKKDDKNTIAQIQKNYEEALARGIEKYGQGFNRKATPLVRPAGSDKGLLIDCDKDERYAGNADYTNSYILAAKSVTAPIVYALEKGTTPLTPEDIKSTVYSGCYGKVLFNFYPYNANVNAGIACGLDSVMKTKGGESLGGRVNAMDYWGDELTAAADSMLGDDYDPLG